MKCNNFLFLDFEFNQVTEQYVNLVCCTTFDEVKKETKEFWLHNNSNEKNKLVEHLKSYKTLVGYACVAESRSLISLGLNPLDFEWLDLFFEYRCLTNHNDELSYGKQLVDGKVKMTFKPRPKWERVEGEIATGFKPKHSLAEATYKLLDVIRDTKHKTEMRDLIISNPFSFSGKDKRAIIEYCTEDVVHLPKLLRAMVGNYKKLLTYNSGKTKFDKSELLKEMKVRGRYAAHTAWMENHGYPINFDKTKNFSKSVQNIIFETQSEINTLFPSVSPFRWNKKEQRFSLNENSVREWIAEQNLTKNWIKTDTGRLSLSLEAFEKVFPFKHDYPKDNFGAQMLRFLKLKQNLYGFVPSGDKSKKTFWDNVGSDRRVRAYLNPYMAQSSRSQPGSIGFMFLKPAWMRALVEPEKGKFLAGIDFGSQEFFIQALLSEDKNMIDAYLSGDPYIYFGIKSGGLPKGATKESHNVEREPYKSTVLGISFLMTRYGLSTKLTTDTGKLFTEDDAQELIDQFYEAFSGLQDFQAKILEEYEGDGFIKLPCSYYMWGDNENFRSTSNVVVQGFGASILRKSVDIAVSKGCKVLKTLHDAIYIEGDVGNEGDVLKLRDAMREGFAYYFPESQKEIASRIKLDPFIWGPDYKPNSSIEVEGYKISCSNLYIDKRAKKEYEQFKDYFNTPDTDLL